MHRLRKCRRETRDERKLQRGERRHERRHERANTSFELGTSSFAFTPPPSSNKDFRKCFRLRCQKVDGGTAQIESYMKKIFLVVRVEVLFVCGMQLRCKKIVSTIRSVESKSEVCKM
jgi:hypothetical protein